MPTVIHCGNTAGAAILSPKTLEAIAITEPVRRSSENSISTRSGGMEDYPAIQSVI